MKKKLRRPLSFIDGFLPADRSQAPTDIVAGFTLAALAIPAVMGYTRIAGMPVITGLYTLLIPMAAYAFFGSSRHLVVGADSATAAIMTAGLVQLASAGSPEYVAYAGMLALMSGVFLVAARLIRLGFIADFLSRTVLVGFLTGVGIQVAIGQISGMLGVSGGGAGPVQELAADIQQLDQANPYTLAVAVSVLAIIFASRKINKKIPGPLIAVIGAILVSYLFDLAAHGVAVLGAVPSGLPKIGLPTGVDLNLNVFSLLMPIAFSMFVVILAQSAATSRAYAARYFESFNENKDLVGLSLANFAAGLSGAFVVNGSPTKTQMVASAGGRSQLASLTTSVIVLFVLLFLTRPLAYMPEAVLASVVFMIGVELVDAKGMLRIFDERPVEFWVALVTALVVIFIGVEEGILLAILLSILIHTRHGYRPKNAVLRMDNTGRQYMVPVSWHSQVIPGLIIYRFHHSMYFANSEHLSQEVLELVEGAEPPVSWFCIDAIAVDDIDFSAAAVLRETCTLLKSKGVRLVMAEVGGDILRELDRSGLVDMIGIDGFFETISDVEAAYRGKSFSRS